MNTLNRKKTEETLSAVQIDARELEERTVCIDPKTAIGKTEMLLAEMMRSHNWLFGDAKPFGGNGIVIRFNCSKCKLFGHAVIQTE